MVVVRVEQAHIDNGEKNDCKICPIALALVAILKDEWRVNVEADTVVLLQSVEPHAFVELSLPELAVEFIEEFDRGLPVVPFTFELDIGDLVK